MPLHPNINADDLTEDGFLLDEGAKAKVAHIEEFVATLRVEIQPLLSSLQDKEEVLTELDTRLTAAYNPYDYLESKLFPPSEEETAAQYRARARAICTEFKQKLKSTGAKNFLDEAIKMIGRVSPREEDKYELSETCYEQLASLWEVHVEDAIDELLAQQLEEQTTLVRHEVAQLQEKLDQYKQQIAAFKAEHGYEFDLDEAYHLKKISKRSEGIAHSILYMAAGQDEKPVAFVLYHGSQGRALGEGAFGRVKLCQNLKTGEWRAVKVQQSIMRTPSQGENKVLAKFSRFFGEALRDRKYYSVQSLLKGEDLEKYLLKEEPADLSMRLTIAKKAIACVQAFHQHFLHRDIKPANFMWDEKAQTLYLCDFGMACPLENGADSVEDLSGSGSYLAPEIDSEYHRGKVLYSKKSDIYALGHVLGALFDGVKDTPPAIEEIIDEMTQHEVNARNDDLVSAIEKIDELLAITQDHETVNPCLK